MPSAPRDFSRSGTLYSVLGVTNDSTQSEIKAAYRKLAYKLHPDRRRGPPGSPSKANAEFSLVASAYEVLSDEQKRDIYDAFGADALRFHDWIMGLFSDGGASASPSLPLPPVLLLSTTVVGSATALLLLAVFLVLFTLRHDGALPASASVTAIVFAPLLLATPLLVGLRALLGARSSADLVPSLLRHLPIALLLLAFEALLCQRLIAELQPFVHPDDLPPWLGVFSPLLIAVGVGLSRLPADLHAARRAAARAGAATTAAAAAAAAATATAASAPAASSPLHARHTLTSEEDAPYGVVSMWRSLTNLDWLSRLRVRWLRLSRWLIACADTPLLGSSRRLLWLLLSAAQLSLLPPRLEGLLRCRWRLLLLPTWAWLLLEFAVTAASCRYHSSSVSDASRTGHYSDTRTRRRRHGGSAGVRSRFERPPPDFAVYEDEEAEARFGAGAPDHDDDDQDLPPRVQLRRALAQWGRGLQLVALVTLALLLSWCCGAADAAESYRAPSSQLMMPLLLALLSMAGCGACACCSAASTRRTALRAWQRERTRARRSPPGDEGLASPAAMSTPRGISGSSGSSSGGGGGGCGGSGGGSELASSPFTPRREADDVDPEEVIAAAMRDFVPGTPLPGFLPEPEPEPRPAWEQAFEGLAEEEEDALAGEEQEVLYKGTMEEQAVELEEEDTPDEQEEKEQL
jgi:hypothetical protein